jgi:transcription initiation factor TFIIIB Brf1 subunit/transcription initiation factor TFIIB
MTNDWPSYPFGRYKKAKYKLYINKEVQYSFVTTIRSEEDCVEVLKEMAQRSISRSTKSFSITKTVDENTITLFRGLVKGI